MLFLLEPTDCGERAASRRVPLSERSAERLERALLAPDAAACTRELISLFADDLAIAQRAIDATSRRLGRDATSLEEAAATWADFLETDLAASLVTVDAKSTHSHAVQEGPPSVEARLPALAAKLAGFQRRWAEFDARLEHEKLESLKELAYGASHEINNPLANIAARAQSLLQDEVDPDRRRMLSAVHRQALRAHEMIADLMLIARPPKLKLAPCDVCQLAAQAAAQHRELAAQREINLACLLDDEPILPVMADETQIAVAIDAIVLNAIEAVGANGFVQIAVRPAVIDGEPFAEILVRDDGPGISENVRRHMFDPFFSGREAGRGLGFGLSKCWRIVTDHGGRVVVYQSATGQGAKIAILLPVADCAVPG
jgi:hypothetical protein